MLYDFFNTEFQRNRPAEPNSKTMGWDYPAIDPTSRAGQELLSYRDKAAEYKEFLVAESKKGRQEAVKEMYAEQEKSVFEAEALREEARETARERIKKRNRKAEPVKAESA